jgi:transposase
VERQYSAAELERTLKVQEVIAKAIARKLTWWEAAEIIGVTDRTMRRWRARIEEDGYTSLYARRKHPSPKRIPLEQTQEVLKLYQQEVNERHFREKLVSEHGIQLSYTWVKGVAVGRVGEKQPNGVNTASGVHAGPYRG